MRNIIILLVMPLFMMAQSSNCNCCTENHSAFDFWIGNWEVTNANGSPAGTNSITKEEGNCVIRENWTSASSGFTGTSLNYYNQRTNEWEQLWVDNSGNVLKLKGNRVGNKMILSSDEFTHTDGKIYTNRITWTLNEDGSVRQLWEMVQGDEVKNVLFDGLYIRQTK